MRLIGTVGNEKKAFTVYSILLEQGIHSTYEKQFDPAENRENMAIWIYEEDQIQRAVELLEAYKQNPDDPRYAKIEFPPVPPQPPDTIAEGRVKKGAAETPVRPWKAKLGQKQKRVQPFPITYFLILTCALLFLWNGAQQFGSVKRDGKLGAELGFTPIQQELMFDYPVSNQAVDALLKRHSLKGVESVKDLPEEIVAELKQAQNMPHFQGYLPYLIYWFKGVALPASLDGPLFVKIGEGQIWRLFTPCLLHAGILHILFNMAWAWLLLRQVEQRLAKWKLLLLILIIGIVSNVAQYFVSGPYFVGFSGVVVGLVGFIWVRQKLAPWEGYPLQRSTFLFILIFVLAMFLLELISIATAAMTAKEISANIANTAHIVGGLTGLLLGRLSFFSRSCAR